MSLTDDGHKLVLSRLGSRLRVAGTCELNGYSRELNPVRCEAITRRVRELFPAACDYDGADLLGRLAAADAIERAVHRQDALRQPVPQYRAWHARLDDGVRLGPRDCRYRLGPSTRNE